MGGSSKKQTVGYKYYLGMHMILTHGPADFLRRITVDSKTAASGFFLDGPISINKPNLFGGEKREGGVVGTVDLEMGAPTQGRNSYLQARLGSSIPAFRGVVGVVLRQVYLGVNPYLKRWAFRLQRINLRGIEGQDQWYKSKAPIGSFSNTALYLAIDISNSMATVTSNGKTRLENMKAGLEAAFTPLLGLPSTSTVDITVVAFAGSYVQITRRGVGGADIQDIIDWINARDYSDVSNGTTQFDVAIGQAPTFFAGSGSKSRVSVFITDGEATGGTEIPAGIIFDSIADLSGYGINIDLTDTTDTAYLDNTPQDGIPVVSGGDTSAIENAIVNAIFAHFDMNPAHIIRECLTDLDWGMGYQESDIDDASFTAAADTLYNENMGISLLWDRQNTIEAFVQEVVKHIDAALYVDRTTGKFILKLIRYDYDENTLIELDESNVAQIQNLHRPSFGELVNSVTVNYWDYQTGETSSLTVQDTALALMQQASINTTVQYPGFSNGRIASLAAARDLKALSTPLWSCTVYADKTADVLNIGDTFKLSWADYGLSSVIMRVTGMAFGNSKSNRVKLICTQDVFALPEAAVISAPPPEDGWTPIDNTALPLSYRMVQEAPYYELVQLLGQTAIDDDLTANADLGYVMAAGAKPSAEGSINALMYVDPSTGTYEDSDTMDFSPTAFLNGAIDEDTLTFPIQNGQDLDLVEVGQHCQIDDEICRVDAISDTSLTLGRAVLDTVPAKHADGAPVIFWDNYPASDEVEYVASDVINVKLLTVTGEGVLDEASAPVDTVTLASRAIRPYPPGNLTFNALYYPDSLPNSPLALLWAHRDRSQQTAGVFNDFLDGDIGPEVGTTYEVQVWDENDVQVENVTGITGTSFDYTDELTDLNTFVYAPSGIYSTGAEVPPTVPTTGLVAEYLFDTAGATLVDETSTYPGTITGAEFRPFDRFPYALEYSSGDRVDIGTALAYETISVSIWARGETYNQRMVDSRGTGAVGSVKGIQLKDYNTATGDYLLLDDGAGQSILLSADTHPLPGNPNDGDWHHWVFTYDGTSKELKLYFDGTLEHTEVNLSMGSIVKTSLPHYLGFPSNGSGSQNFTGRLSRCRIYNAVLDQTGVDQLYAEKQPGPRLIQNIPTSVLSGWVTLNNGDIEISTLQDYSGDGSSIRKITNSDPNGGYYALPNFDMDNEAVEIEVWTYRPTGYTGGQSDRIGLRRDDGLGIGFNFDNVTGDLNIDQHDDVNNISGTTSSPATVNVGGIYADQWRRFVVSFESPDTSGGSTIRVIARMYDGAGNLLGSVAYDKTSFNNGSNFTGVFIVGGYEYFVDSFKVTHFGPAYAAGVEYRYNEKIRARLASRRDGYESYQVHDLTLYRNGYGYRYGSAYGGN